MLASSRRQLRLGDALRLCFTSYEIVRLHILHNGSAYGQRYLKFFAVCLGISNMATARLRKAFRYPTESENGAPAEGIDEEGQLFSYRKLWVNKTILLQRDELYR